MTAFLASRALGILRQTALAAQFQTGPEADAFFAAFRIPDLLFNLVVGGALNSAFIPVFARLLEQGEDIAAWRLAATVLNTVVLALALLGGVAALCSPLLAPLLAPGFDPATQALVGDLGRVLFLQPLFFGVGAVAFAVLNARQHFLVPAWAPVVYNLFQLASLAILTPRLGIVGLAIGVVAGSVAYAAMQLPVLLRHGFRYAAVLEWGNAAFRRVVRLLLPRTATLALLQVGGIVTTTVLASTISGGVAALAYAYQVLLLPIGLLGVSVATATFPTLSAMAGGGELTAVRDTVRTSLRLLLYAGMGGGALLCALAPSLVALLFEHGKFGAQEAQAVSLALRWYALGLFAHLADELLPRAFFALQDTRTPFAINAATVVANIALSLLFRPWLGLGGIALALTLAACLEMALYLAWLGPRLPALVDARFLRTLACLALAALLAGLGAAGGARLVPSPNGGATAANLARLVLGGAVGAMLYLGATAALGVGEQRQLLDRLGGRGVRRGERRAERPPDAPPGARPRR